MIEELKDNFFISGDSAPSSTFRGENIHSLSY